jgi:hypothetical protein
MMAKKAGGSQQTKATKVGTSVILQVTQRWPGWIICSRPVTNRGQTIDSQQIVW